MKAFLPNLIPHLCGVLGLVFNTAGAFGLIRFTGKAYAGSPLTVEQIRSLEPVLPQARRYAVFETLGFRVSLWFLAGGFVLQLIDLLRG